MSSFRDWVDYRDGFGDFKLWNDELWLGNEHIYSLLSEGQQLLKKCNINSHFMCILYLACITKLSSALFLNYSLYVFAIKVRTW